MAMPTPPPKPPSRQGNSQQQVVPHDVVQQKARPREMHPAVQEAMGRYAQVWDENDKLRDENTRLVHDNEVLRSLDKEKTALIDGLRKAMAQTQEAADARLDKAEQHYRERLAEAERAKERYLRYAVSISTDIKSIIAAAEAADHTAMEMAHTPGEKQLSDIDAAIAEATTHAMDQRSASLDIPISKTGEA